MSFAQSTATVPFVGCPAEGQVGPVAPPSEPASASAPLSRAADRRLVLYSHSLSVLAPRGWKCIEITGSSGYALLVMPSVPEARVVLEDRFRIDGPFVLLRLTGGDGSGRNRVADVIDRVFPKHRAYSRQVRKEFESADPVPTGPWPADTLRYRNDSIVEFTTAPRKEGLGTDHWVTPNGRLIRGIVILHGENRDLTHLSLRLPPSLEHLAPAIIQHVAR